MLLIKSSLLFFVALILSKSLSSFIKYSSVRSYNQFSILKLSGGSSRYGYTDDEDYNNNKLNNTDDSEDDNFQEETDNIDLDGEEENESNEDNNNSAIQFMITRKMKKILVDELGYLISEVDQMEPQIAAVVIERSLNRPSNGMPNSWKRVETNNDNNNDNDDNKKINKKKNENKNNGIQNLFKNMNNFLNNKIIPSLPTVLTACFAIGAIYNSRHVVSFIANSINNKMKENKAKKLITESRKQKDKLGARLSNNNNNNNNNNNPQNSNKKINNNSKNNVPNHRAKALDLNSLNEVQTQSFWDKIRLQTTILKKKLF